MSKEVRGWKEIAAFLDVSVRTAQSREKEGLPIRRRSSHPKAPVAASVADLEQWLARRAQAVALDGQYGPQNDEPAGAEGTIPPMPEPVLVQASALPEQEPAAGPAAQTEAKASTPRMRITSAARAIRRVRQRIAVATLTTLALGTLVLALIGRPSRTPERTAVASNVLSVFGRSGALLWQRAFEYPLIETEYTKPDFRHALISDIDGDGHPEVLFVVSPINRQDIGTALYCFTGTGRIKWQFVPGREVSDRHGPLPNRYYISNVAVIPKTASGGPWIVITSNHYEMYPNQVAVLDGTGKLLGDYWHAGHLQYLTVSDIDGDGHPEILLGGVNNGYQQATLVVLDPRRVYGQSRQPAEDHRQFVGMTSGAEEAVVLFPRTCISQRLFEFNRVNKLVVAPRFITVNVVESVNADDPMYIVYQLDPALKSAIVTPSDQFLSRHKMLETERVLDHVFKDREGDALRQGLSVSVRLR